MREGWEYKKLGDIATYINGYAFKPSDWIEEGTPIIRIQNLTDASSRFNRCIRTDIPEKYKVSKGDVLISWSATLGVFEWNREDAWLNQHIFKVVFDKVKINKHFFEYIVESSLEEMALHTNGATMKHIRKGDFDNILVPYPPLSEQQEIVEYLDSAFAKIDAMKANAEKAFEEGKALFQAALKQMLEPKEGWEEKTVSEIAGIKGGKRIPKGEKLLSEPTNHKYIRVSDFNDNGSVDLGNIQYISDEVYSQIKRYIINKEDVYISIAGTIGKSGIVPDELDGANLTENACRLILSNVINQKFMYYVTISPEFVRQEKVSTKISAQPKLALTRLADINVSFPSLIEQQAIVETLDTIKSKVDQLQKNFDTIVKECDTLKQAILRQVFE